MKKAIQIRYNELFELKCQYAAEAGFSDIAGLAEFAAIKEAAENSEVYEIAPYEMQLFALRGKNMQIASKPQSTSVAVGIDQDEKPVEDDGYGGLVYRAKKRRR